MAALVTAETFVLVLLHKILGQKYNMDNDILPHCVGGSKSLPEGYQYQGG